jgi:hypothetical protein
VSDGCDLQEQVKVEKGFTAGEMDSLVDANTAGIEILSPQGSSKLGQDGLGIGQ